MCLTAAGIYSERQDLQCVKAIFTHTLQDKIMKLHKVSRIKSQSDATIDSNVL